MKKLLISLVLLVPLLSSAQGTTYSFDNYQDFKNAVTGKYTAPQPGDVFILEDGTYDNSGTITPDSIQGTAENPIVIRAENVGGVIFNDALGFDLRRCSYMIIQGFNFELVDKSNVIKLQACNNIQITQNTFDGATEITFDDPDDVDEDDDYDREDAVWISIQGHYDDDVTLSHDNQVDHNVFKNKTTLGNIIKIDGTNDTQVSQYDVIEYNYFKNVGPRADNEMEAIRVGWSAMSESDGYCTISNNLFEECDGDPEIISIKCNKNTISHNTFRRCAGTLSLRHGNESVVEGNFFLGEGYTEAAVDSFPDADGDNGSGGVRIYGADHKIINNYFEGLTGTKWDAPITLTYGDAEVGGGLTDHWRIEDAIIANNTLVNNDYGIEIGYDNAGKYDKPPTGVIIAYNIITSDTNSLVNYRNAASDITWLDNIVYPTGSAIVGEGTSYVDFTTDEAQQINPELVMGSSYYNASASTPTLTPSSSSVGTIEEDIDGQDRTATTNYGADQYIDGETVIYEPLTPADVGQSDGEYIYSSTAFLSVAKSGDTISVYVSSDLSWDVSSDDTWATIDPGSGTGDESIAIMVAENTSGAQRSTTVSIISNNATDGTVSATIQITQYGTDAPELTISTSGLSLDATAQSTDVDITSNVDWTATASDTWITVTPASGSDNGTLSITVEENTLTSERVGSIMVTDSNTLSQFITVTQAGNVGSEIKLPIISVTASTEQTPDNVADNVFDGDYTNRWSAEGDSVTIDLNLDSLSVVSYVKIGLFKGSERITFFDILTSEDGVTFTEALMGQTTTISSETIEIADFDDINAQYVRIIARGTSTDAVPDVNSPTGTWNSFTEFEVWGMRIAGTETGNIEIENAYDVKVFPNPNQGTFTINAPANSNITVFNATGAIVYTQKTLSEYSSISDLNKGLYFVSIETKNNITVKKVIVE